LASIYEKTEPHFRSENIEIVETHIKKAAALTGTQALLDLGCGTGFVINIAKRIFKNIIGVDVTPAMLAKVDKTGDANIQLHEHDTGTFAVEPASFDVVTAYSFLHHLYDIRPTLATAAKALKQGGIFYADLDPNFYFWNSISELTSGQEYDPIVQREIEHVTHKDSEMNREHNIPNQTFNDAEYGKSALGGFKEETLRKMLFDVGFSNIEFHYYWFLGQAQLVNDENMSREDCLRSAKLTDAILQRVLPLSRNLYKYIGFTAHK